MKRALILAVSIIIAHCSILMAEEKTRIAVLDFKANDVSIYAAKAVSDIIGTEMTARNEFTMIERAQINAILTEQGFQQAGCTEQECAVQVGKLLSAKKILVGSLSRLGTVYAINAKIVDVESARAEYAESERCTREDDLEPAARILAVKLVNKISGKSYPIPERTYIAEEPRPRFACALGYTYNWYQANWTIPVLKGAALADSKVKMGSIRFNMSPSYDLTDVVTLKSSIEYIVFQSDFPSNTSEHHATYDLSQYVTGGTAAYLARTLGIGFDVQFNYRARAYVPYFSVGAEYMRCFFSNDGMTFSTYAVDYPGGVNYYSVDYKLVANSSNVLMGRANVGVMISLSRYVDLNISGGVSRPLGTPVFNGLTIRKTYENTANDGGGTYAGLYGDLEHSLRNKAANYTSGERLLLIMAQGEVVLRLF